ncbi:Adenosylmethionine-8-amino-7-oxononanoate aminotransferase [Azospirillaceae bacterium]
MKDDIVSLTRDHVWRPFTQEAIAPDPMVAVRGKGAYLYTSEGRAVLDLISSWWVNLHGHAHPDIARAIARQAETLEQVIFADFTHAPAARLAARLASLLPGDLDRAFFSDDGSTAVEVALKMALQYFANIGQEDRTRILAFEGGYHGDTVGAMSVGRSSGYFRAWESLLFPVEVLPYPETWIGDDAVEAKEAAALTALEKALTPQIAAVIVEPLVQGAGGMRMCRPSFLRALADRVRAAGALLIFDEVMTGFGRAGSVFACVGVGVTPDFVCLSKGLTGGFLPMGVTVAREAIHQAFLGKTLQKAFLHGHSYTANPLSCAAGLASLDLLLSDDCRGRIAAVAAIHCDRLSRFVGFRPRSVGTIAAVTIGEGGYEASIGSCLKEVFRKQDMLLRPLGSVAYFLPPYCIEPLDLHRAWDVLECATQGMRSGLSKTLNDPGV